MIADSTLRYLTEIITDAPTVTGDTRTSGGHVPASLPVTSRRRRCRRRRPLSCPDRVPSNRRDILSATRANGSGAGVEGADIATFMDR